MPSFKMSVPHSLGREEALKRLKSAASNAKKQHAGKVTIVKEEWHASGADFEVSSMGFRVSGNVLVEDDQIAIDADIPFAALPFKGRVENMIRERAKEFLA